MPTWALPSPRCTSPSWGWRKSSPDYDALALYIRLLARSATGQPSTTYTSHYKKPAEGQEMHIVIVDNGRSDILANARHVGMLKCLRCGSCINTCPVYRRTGGYSYSYFIPGPVGINLGMLRSPRDYAGNVSACSLCGSCSNVCPVKIDLAEQILLLAAGPRLPGRGRLGQEADGEGHEDRHGRGKTVSHGHPCGTHGRTPAPCAGLQLPECLGARTRAPLTSRRKPLPTCGRRES